MHTIYLEPDIHMKKLISKPPKSWISILRNSKRILIPVNHRGRNFRWVVIGLDVIGYGNGRIFILHSVLEANLIGTELITSKKWAENAGTRTVVGDWWPTNCIFDMNYVKSVQQRDAKSFELDTCVNIWTLASGLSDFSYSMTRLVP